MKIVPIDLDNNYLDLDPREPAPRQWSEAAIIQQNEIYGKYVVASRLIEAGELLIEEIPLSVAVYGTSDLLPFCLACGKDLALSERCRKCKWPICDNKGTCENDSLHAEGECPIFVANGLRPKKLTLADYGAIEVLRGLLFRSRDPERWERILTFESHSKCRKESPVAAADTDFIVTFIRDMCKMVEFERETIDRVVGVYSVNTFWAFKDTGKYLSLLFDKVTLFSHDCDPNTKRQILEREAIVAGRKETEICIEIVARRDIRPGDTITTSYTNISEDVSKRQKYLSEAFYFNCKCERCILELDDTSCLIKTN